MLSAPPPSWRAQDPAGADSRLGLLAGLLLLPAWASDLTMGTGPKL